MIFASKLQFHENETKKIGFLQDSKITIVDRCLQFAFGVFMFENTWTSFTFETTPKLPPAPLALNTRFISLFYVKNEVSFLDY